MGKRGSFRQVGVLTLFLFAWSCLFPGFVRGDEEDPLAEARRLIRAGSYDEATRVLGAYIEKIRDIAKQRGKVAEAHYLLAKMYFEVGDDATCDENLRAALRIDPEMGVDEPSADFRERLGKIRSEVAPQVFEKLKKAEQRRLKSKKKFPWLLVVGAAAAAILVVLLMKKKKKNYTLTVTIGAGVSGTPAAGSYSYPKGTSVNYSYEAGADYKDLSVRINGGARGTSGSLVMNSDVRLEATAVAMSIAAELVVKAKENCFELAGSAAAMQQIPGGNYTLNITGNAYYVGTANFGYVFGRYYGADNRFHLAAFNSHMTLSLNLAGTPPNCPFYAFFLDSGNLNDNSGFLVFNFGSIQFNVYGKTNCILIESIPMAKIAVPAGTYFVRVSGNAYYAPATPMNEVLVSFITNNGGNVSLALTVGQTTTIVTNGSTFYAFFADWSGIDDNSGQVRLEFLR